jgi:hypothetical protein
MIPTTETIQRAAEILRQIESLQAELAGLFGGGSILTAPKRRGRPPGSGKAAPPAPAPQGSTKKRRMSAEGRARIAAAAKARWAKFHAERKSSAKG